MLTPQAELLLRCPEAGTISHGAGRGCRALRRGEDAHSASKVNMRTSESSHVLGKTLDLDSEALGLHRILTMP